MSEREESPQLPVQGEPLAVDLVDTEFVDGGLRGHRVDALRTTEELRQWLLAHHAELGLPGKRIPRRCTAVQLRAFRELRAALRELCAAAVASDRVGGVDGAAGVDGDGGPWPAEARATVNEAVRGALSWRELPSARGESGHEVWSAGDPVLAALARVAADGVDLLAGPRAAQLRACGAPGCILYFVKTRPRREWCSTGCGTRARVARHERRKRATAADG